MQVDPQRLLRILSAPFVKAAFAIFFFLGFVLSLPAADQVNGKKPFILYAQFLEDTRVDLSDGAVWMMEKGDCFPIYMFKEHQTKVVLQLASANFTVDAKSLKVLPEAQNPTALESYRKNLSQYLNNRADAWKKVQGIDDKKTERAKTEQGR